MSRALHIEERAARWLLLREEPEWSAADQAELDEWLAESDAHKAAFWRLEYGWRKADRIAALGAAAEPASHRFNGLSWWTKPVAIAASLLLVFAVSLVQWPNWPIGGRGQGAAMAFETPVGGHKFVSLPDGSRVELNTDTRIRAVVDNRRRAVWLERGEAFFDVAKNGGRQFVIYAGSRTITVLGTKFSVRREPLEVVVAVLEGRVRVADTSAPAAEHDATVAAGDVAIARARTTLVTQSAGAVEQELAWRRGQLHFEGVTLASVVEEFNRYNRKQLVIGDSDAASRLIGGIFQARNLAAFARALEQGYGLDVQDSGSRIILSSKRMAYRGPLKQLRPELAPPRTQSHVRDASSAASANPLATPAAPAVQVASASNLKAVRDEKNWEALHKLYPPRALAAREEGLVGFTVKIDGRGNPTQCRVTHSSGHPLLDQETCKLILVNATFKRPTGLSPSQQRSYEGVVNWKLPTTARSSVPVAPSPIAVADAPEEMICKRVPVTGSNVATQRTCMTKSEWDRASNETRQQFLDRVQRPNSCVGPNC